MNKMYLFCTKILQNYEQNFNANVKDGPRDWKTDKVFNLRL